MNPAAQSPLRPSRRDLPNDDASSETVSRPIHLLRIDASPRASKSNSIALTDAFVTAYTDALPAVTVDVMNVWDEKLPEQEYREDLPTPPSRFDHQSSYVEFWLHFIGVQDVRALAVENAWGDKAEASMRAAREEVAVLAKEF